MQPVGYAWVAVMLALHNVHMKFGTRPVLADVSCHFEHGKITGLIGDNGAGKTTLLRIATTVLMPQRGETRLDDRPLAHNDVARRMRLGALIEKPGHYDELTVRENLRFFYSFHCRDRETCTSSVNRALERFHLETVADENLGTLSTGYRQRVAVARAFHPQARIVLLDEPMDGLDPTTRSHLKDTIRSLARDGVALCVSSHGLSDLDALCDRLYVLAHSRLYEFASFNQIRTFVEASEHSDLDTVYTQLLTRLASDTQ